ncbi:MAG: signal peptide peptidase SppA [Hyphomicrobiales bacterium]|nr:signal peptide peptidase SppA [Hyphomicrobiales bacterium]
MSLETEMVLDRRNLRRRMGLWRGLAIAAAVIAVGAVIQVTGFAGSVADTRHVARVSIEGMITEDRSMLRLLRRLETNRNVAGVILFINSPGGTTTGGEALYESIRSLSAKKPVVAQFGTVAASAAYITGLGADHIVARGNSITGSVGVIFQWPEVSGLLDKVGVKMNEIKSGPLKAVPSLYEPISPEGRRTAEAMVAESQRWFVGLVASRRGVKTAEIPGLEEGRVFSGREALSHKLVDAVGGENEVLRWLNETRSVPKDLRIVDWRPRRDNDFGLLRFMGLAIARMVGGEAAEAFVSDERTFGRLALDGLVSVWQPPKSE